MKGGKSSDKLIAGTEVQIAGVVHDGRNIKVWAFRPAKPEVAASMTLSKGMRTTAKPQQRSVNMNGSYSTNPSFRSGLGISSAR
jgi:hypothetical protein